MVTATAHMGSAIVGGRVLQGGEFIEHCKKHGLCTICGQYRTHKKTVVKMRMRLEPIELQQDEQGHVTVYKGHCIQPTCYTSVEQVQVLLGEIDSPRRQQHHQPSTPRLSGSGPANYYHHRHSVGAGGGPPSVPQLSSPLDVGVWTTPASPSGNSTGSSKGLRRMPFVPSGVYQPPQQLASPGVMATTANGGMTTYRKRISYQQQQQQQQQRNGSALSSSSLSAGDSPVVTAAGTAPSVVNTSAIVSPPLPLETCVTRSRSRPSFRSNNSTSLSSSLQSPPQLNTQQQQLQQQQGDYASRHKQLLQQQENTTNTEEGLLEESKREETTLSQDRKSNISEMESLVADGEYIGFLNELDLKGTDKMVVLEGFHLLRYYLVQEHLQRPNGSSVLNGCENWVKTIHDRISASRSSHERINNTSNINADKDIVVSGILTFLTLSTLPGSYRRDMLKKGSVDMTLMMIDGFNGYKEVCVPATALFLSLSLKDGKDGLNAKYGQIAKLVNRMASMVTSGEYGRDYALRVLFHLSNQKRRVEATRKSLSHDVKASMKTDKNIQALFDILMEPQVRETSVEAAVCLLWRMSIPKDEEETEGLLPISENSILALVRVMEAFDSISIREASCGILANLSMRQDFSFDLVQPCFQCMHRFLVGSNLSDEGLAICSAHAICNTLAGNASRALLVSDQRILETTINLLRLHPTCEELVENACLVLAHAGHENRSIKDAIIQMGGFNLVKESFDRFVISRGEEQSFEVKDASLCAIATLSGCHSGVQAIIQDGFCDTLQALWAVETDSDFAQILEVIVTNCQNGAINGFTLGHQENSRESPALFSDRAREAPDDTAVATLFQGMTGVVQAVLEAAVIDEGFTSVIEAMTRFADSASVQEHACALISEIYFYPPKTSSERSPWSRECRNSALDAVHRAMGFHLNESSVQNNACLAILNVLSRFPSADGPVFEVIPVLLDDILEAFRLHGSDRGLHFSGALALLALTIVARSGDVDLSRWADTMVRRLADSISRFPGDVSTQTVVLDVFLSLQKAHMATRSIGSPPVIAMLLDLVSNDNGDVAGRVSAVLACLVQMDFVATSHIMENPGSIRSLLVGIVTHPNDLHLHINLCWIMVSLVNFGGDFIAQFQGNGNEYISSICNGICRHKQSTDFTKYACRLLSALVPTFNVTLSSSTNKSLQSALLTAMDQHVENAQVEADVFDALWSVCKHNDEFKTLLIEESRVTAIIGLVQLHLGSEELQRSGCRLIGILSGSRPGKAAIGSHGGVAAVVNGLFAHNESTSVQKEGLLALKNLATESCNKQFIAESGGEDAVFYSLWIHYRDPLVLSSGLSALNNIAVDGATRSVAKMRDQILPIILGAMARFPDDVHVQKNACFYLKSCSYLPANLQMMVNCSEQLTPLLFLAADKFPGQCQDRANGIIEKIQPQAW